MRIMRWLAGTLSAIRWLAATVASLFVLALLVLVIKLIVGASLGGPHVPRKAALVIAPVGALVEQKSTPVSANIGALMTGAHPRKQTVLRRVVAAIDAGASDDRIQALVIKPQQLAPASVSKLHVIAKAVARFKKSGKPVFAMLDNAGQSQYYLAANADTIFLNPHGHVLIRGFGAYHLYFKDASDQLGINWNVVRVGQYKSFVEPFTRNNMSDAARAADKDLLDVLWSYYIRYVAQARDIKPATVRAYADHAAKHLKQTQGDAAQVALNAGLVDTLATRDQQRAAVAAVVGTGSSHAGFHNITALDYLHATHQFKQSQPSTHEVAVIVAQGDILAGRQPAGRIGGRSLSAKLQKARHDDHVKAVVLRVDSPGGSAFASQMIQRQIELTRQAGKPVVVSMGAVAASGGYWISMSADLIYAHPTTITGSIGILGMFPTFEKSLAKIGVHSDGVGTTALSGDGRVTRAMSPQAKQIMSLAIRHGYQRFVHAVAKARGLDVATVKAVAQGRVWSGVEAKKFGLIDHFGGLNNAIHAAARLSGISANYSVRYLKHTPSLRARLMHAFLAKAASATGDTTQWAPAQRMLTRVQHWMRRLARFNDPQGLYAYCFCGQPLQR